MDLDRAHRLTLGGSGRVGRDDLDLGTLLCRARGNPGNKSPRRIAGKAGVVVGNNQDAHRTGKLRRYAASV